MNPQTANTPSSNRSQYSLSVEQASEHFSRAGTPRSPRTIIRYCSGGHLDCIKVDTEQNEKYLISPESVDRRIQELQQIAKSSHVSPQRDESRHDESGPDADKGGDPEVGKGDRAKLEKRIESLKAQIMDLKITNRAKDYFLEQLKSEHAALLDQVSQQSKLLGELETRLELATGSKPPTLSIGKRDDNDRPPGDPSRAHGQPPGSDPQTQTPA